MEGGQQQERRQLRPRSSQPGQLADVHELDSWLGLEGVEDKGQARRKLDVQVTVCIFCAGL